MSFSVELNHVDRTWLEAAYAPDAVYFAIRGDGNQVSGYDHLKHFLRLYEQLCVQRENTQNRFAVVEIDSGIHIVLIDLSTPKTVFSTTYDDALSEVKNFLLKVFQRLEMTDTGRWQNQQRILTRS